MRPGPSRSWASAKPAPRPPIRFSSGTRQRVYRISECVGQPSPACPITGMLRTSSKPAVSQGTRIMEARKWGGASGSVTAITTANAAPSAPEVNHLCPSITHCPRSRTARLQPGRIGAGPLGLRHREAAADLAGAERPQPPFLLRVGASQLQQLHVPDVRRLLVDAVVPERAATQ